MQGGWVHGGHPKREWKSRVQGNFIVKIRVLQMHVIVTKGREY